MQAMTTPPLDEDSAKGGPDYIDKTHPLCHFFGSRDAQISPMVSRRNI